MTPLIPIFFLIILALVAVAIYEHVNSVTLSLPLSPALTFLTILVPLLTAGNVLALPYLARQSARAAPNNPALFRVTGPIVLQVLQAILTTVLATLFATDIVPSASSDCELSTRWQHLFRAKDADSVRAIQEAFQCCGFRSVHDMAWPFPPAAIECAARFDRALACRGPWADALRKSAGVNFGVVVAVGLLQVLSIVLARRYAGRNSRFSWSDILSRHGARGHGPVGGSASRPLLTDNTAQIQEVDEEVGETEQENERRYGAIEGGGERGPRVEPSSLFSAQNDWRDD
ncbi:hypothetical protein M406DRAFT_356222 [Cryphonectria parasitica EP155]|uniref:Tetraspanin Tsp3 n=1 Tax=Cryphonectria parasitica (strain ATCC 38755 / EP155) TaxID=660469 RepID=A0A9P5CP62_CRYP1|nr:uncharacterized protein M406DRAFT_356222 [Cryphonectria parasitica EP155]KAF3766159.1 hypothetical protein M406DRAFT_356222 [Cryphonectria parasitica EP155]